MPGCHGLKTSVESQTALDDLDILSVTAQADEHTTRGNASTSDEHLFLVFLRRATDDDAAVKFIMSTLLCDTLPPWEEISAELKSNIIEATPEQVEKLANHADIERVVPVEAIAQEEAMPELEDASTKKSYVVWPVNPHDRDQCRATHASLKARFQGQVQAQEVEAWEFGNAYFWKWKIPLTKDEVSQVENIEGVKAVSPEAVPLPKSSKDPLKRRTKTIRPVDPEDQNQCEATDSALKNLFGGFVSASRLRDDKICWWNASLSPEEVAKAEAIPGVLSVRTHHRGRRGAVTKKWRDIRGEHLRGRPFPPVGLGV
ncbi:hypothetical protein IL306_001089 [Fusarium sp. DS 682]|nr:hypothetical protein IL306_001089 [Fusarium sp. DS 682]